MRQTGINMEMVKKRNRASILNYINQVGPISRKDISEALGLTPAAVTQICGEFLECGLLIETGTVEEQNRVGRKKVLIDIDYDHRFVFGIKIDLEKTVIALTNLNGEAVKLREIITAKTQKPDKFLRIIADNCIEMEKEADIDERLIIGAGVGIIGVVDNQNGKSLHAYGIWDVEVPVAEILGESLGKPIIVDNSITAFALAEKLYGCGKEKDNLLFVKWGPGVGSTVLAEGKPYGGKNGHAANIGHYIIEKSNKKCNCGRSGCLETKISYAAITEWLGQVFSQEETPKMYQMLKGDFSNFSRDFFYDFLNDVDEVVGDYMDEILDLFARAIVSIVSILAPDSVVLFSNMFRNEMLCQRLIEYCRGYDESCDETRIIHTVLTDREDYLGPVALFVEEYLYGYGDIGLSL